jgi:hypothetical protein
MKGEWNNSQIGQALPQVTSKNASAGSYFLKKFFGAC